MGKPFLFYQSLCWIDGGFGWIVQTVDMIIDARQIGCKTEDNVKYPYTTVAREGSCNNWTWMRRDGRHVLRLRIWSTKARLCLKCGPLVVSYAKSLELSYPTWPWRRVLRSKNIEHLPDDWRGSLWNEKALLQEGSLVLWCPRHRQQAQELY